MSWITLSDLYTIVRTLGSYLIACLIVQARVVVVGSCCRFDNLREVVITVFRVSFFFNTLNNTS